MTDTRVEYPILLVEDDPNDVALISRALKKARVLNPLHVVADGDEAVEYLTLTGRHADDARDHWPQLILLDLKLPRKSGHEVLRWIRWEAGITRVPVVVLTSSDNEADIKKAYDLGANSYLKKPARLEELQELMGTLDLYWLVLNQTGDISHGP